MKTFHIITSIILAALLLGCSSQKKTGNRQTKAEPVGPAFSADSAYAFCQRQCDFGPRVMNSEAHDACGRWIASQFRAYGLTVIEQQATLRGFDGTPLKSTNIIAQYKPEQTNRILLCAHWDTRPWADNDPLEANHTQPLMGANDGASGVAVMLELARLLDAVDSTAVNASSLGIDFICFDAEDWGSDNNPDSWALGAQHWAAHPHREGYRARYGILLDMVGGQGATFFQEGFSKQKAPQVVDRVWQAAKVVGHGSVFPQKEGGYITDDHGPVNDVAGIPCIDIIAYYPHCEQSSFGPTWHTVDDTMEHIDHHTLKAVGQTLVQVIWGER